MGRENFWIGVRQKSIFPPSLFFVYLGVLLLMSGIHTGLIVGMAACKNNGASFPQSWFMVYWSHW